MKWQGREQSSNVEDRRRRQVRNVGAGVGIGTILMVLFTLFSGGDAGDILQQLQTQTQQPQAQQSDYQPNAAEEELAQFVSVVLKDTEDVWKKLFKENFSEDYREPILVLFSGQTESPCGFASAATGPFYCPGDQKLYIDLSFYQQLKTRFRAPGDFAMAYIVAHEVGHHVQNLLGITNQVQSQRRTLSQTDYNALSVRLELQADFFAGIWAHYAQRMKNILEEGDVEEALKAAAAVGDDRIQKEARGYIVPESFTHGSSEQRMRWFYLGLETGDINKGDTFGARDL